MKQSSHSKIVTVFVVPCKYPGKIKPETPWGAGKWVFKDLDIFCGKHHVYDLKGD